LWEIQMSTIPDTFTPGSNNALQLLCLPSFHASRRTGTQRHPDGRQIDPTGHVLHVRSRAADAKGTRNIHLPGGGGRTLGGTLSAGCNVHRAVFACSAPRVVSARRLRNRRDAPTVQPRVLICMYRMCPGRVGCKVFSVQEDVIGKLKLPAPTHVPIGCQPTKVQNAGTAGKSSAGRGAVHHSAHNVSVLHLRGEREREGCFRCFRSPEWSRCRCLWRFVGFSSRSLLRLLRWWYLVLPGRSPADTHKWNVCSFSASAMDKPTVNPFDLFGPGGPAAAGWGLHWPLQKYTRKVLPARPSRTGPVHPSMRKPDIERRALTTVDVNAPSPSPSPRPAQHALPVKPSARKYATLGPGKYARARESGNPSPKIRKLYQTHLAARFCVKTRPSDDGIEDRWEIILPAGPARDRVYASCRAREAAFAAPL
jgi:hypothetical protein